MAKMLWKDTRVYLLIGIAMLVVAYLSGAGLEVMAWMSIMFVVVLISLVVDVSNRERVKADAAAKVFSSSQGSFEVDLLVRQAEDSTAAMLGHIREELLQMRSLMLDSIDVLQTGFIEINHDTKAQNATARKLQEDIRLALSAGSQSDVVQNEINELLDASILEMHEISLRIDKNVRCLLRVLQCEDIVRQLTESSEKHLNCLNSVLSLVAAGMHDLSGRDDVSEYIAELHELRLQIDRLESECKVAAARSVSQCSMQEGDISLFN